jgi:GAF domain-containing protein
MEDCSEVLVIFDTVKNDRFPEHNPAIRFYAAAPIFYAGIKVGTFSLTDPLPRKECEFDDVMKANLVDMGKINYFRFLKKINLLNLN